MRFIDLTGQRFVRLTVVDRAPDFVRSNGRTRPRWHCRCDCGAETIVRSEHLKSGDTKSCGCLLSDAAKARIAKIGPPSRLTHGQAGARTGTRSPTYVSWFNMIQRTTNPKNTAWKWYGARGITVCPEWRSFENFRADMGDRPEGLTLDRIDVNGDYEPTNCRWATWSEQRRNQRRMQGVA